MVATLRLEIPVFKYCHSEERSDEESAVLNPVNNLLGGQELLCVSVVKKQGRVEVLAHHLLPDRAYGTRIKDAIPRVLRLDFVNANVQP